MILRYNQNMDKLNERVKAKMDIPKDVEIFHKLFPVVRKQHRLLDG
jgi:hypothetical protein